MAGYNGYSKSNNAVEAEIEHKYPITVAISKLAEIAGISKKISRKTLEEIGPCEWHHTSKFYNQTDYYDIQVAANKIRYAPVVLQLQAVNYEERITVVIRSLMDNDAKRLTAINLILNELAAEVGCTPTIVSNAYYETWEEE